MIHSLLRWAIVFLGIWAIMNAISGLSGKRAFSRSDKMSGLFFMIAYDLQLLLGLILYFTGPWFNKLTNDFGGTMKNAPARFFSLEHMMMMLIAWALVHIGYAKVKKAEDHAKHKKMLIFFGIAFLITMAAIPWPFRAALGKGWY
jgi:hypothetical protein